jgi:hypothetical protein
MIPYEKLEQLSLELVIVYIVFCWYGVWSQEQSWVGRSMNSRVPSFYSI